jgi:two-component system phosphate regulon sensor histidine kinase PhoR
VLFSFRAIRQHYIDSQTHDLTNLCITLETDITALLTKNDVQGLDGFVKNLGKHINTRITVIDPAGVVLADSEKNPREMEKHNLRTEIMQALQSGVGTSVRFSSTVKEEMLYVAMPLQVKGSAAGVLRVSLFIRHVDTLLDTLKTSILLSGIVILVLSLLAALFFSNSLARPIRELIAASRRIASGDLSTRVLLKRNDEFRELGDSFNYMADRTSSLFSEVSGKKEELTSIISSIQEGLLVLDRKGKIVLYNKSLEHNFPGVLLDGKAYWEVIREPQFHALVKTVMDERKSHSGELSLQGKTFLCSATFLGTHEETVLLFHDITDIKNVEKIKKDFVINVSHELRTPLTAIKGFVETLEEELDEQHRHYLAIIKRNTDRLINIVQDLLLLSQVEEKGVALQTEEVAVAALLEQIHRIFEPRLREKNISFTIGSKNDIPPVQADLFKLEQVFVNLVDNAIKYTEHGDIRVTLEHRDNQVVIQIQDTGIGIPQEHLPRIFERFYVVDSSRSRRLGGTGLGLSIVKHIVILHNGTIHAESTPGKGSIFTITLPVQPSV